MQAVRIRRVRCIRHVPWWGKYQDFMLMRFFISIDMNVVGTLTNQIPASSARKARKACKACKVVGKKSGFYVKERFSFPLI